MNDEIMGEEISIACRDWFSDGQNGKTFRTVYGERVGDHFAVHEKPCSYREFTVTHVPSGYAIATARTRKMALAAAKVIARQPVDWAAVTPENLKTVIPPEIVERIRKLREKIAPRIVS